MSDQDLPTSGKDTRIQLMINGIPTVVVNQITNFSASRRVTEIETKPIGTSTVLIDQEPEGWDGTLELAQSTAAIDELIDAVDAAQRARIPNSIQIVDITNFRNGTSSAHMYPDIKIQYEKTVRRGQATAVRIPWKTGLARIPL